MRVRNIYLALVSGGLMLAVAIPQRAQNRTAPPSADEHARRSVAVNMLRAVNTAEYEYRDRHGSFVGWDVLVASQEFTGRGLHFAAHNEPQLANVQFLKLPEILPGWALRLNVTADGKGYDLLLEDQTDKTCGYAASTDERAVIRQSKTIDCDI
jgi:hypothetical protein